MGCAGECHNAFVRPELTNSQTGQILQQHTHYQHPVTAAAWAPDGESFVIGSQDQENALSVWDTNDELIYRWKEDKMRVYDLSLSPDGQRLVVLLVSSIVVYDFVTREKLKEWAFDDVKMTSVNISADSKLMLVSMNENKIHLMDIETGDVLHNFKGQQQSEYMIRSAFGGANENFVVSGSEGINLKLSSSDFR
jgi:WD40 repeat protein